MTELWVRSDTVSLSFLHSPYIISTLLHYIITIHYYITVYYFILPRASSGGLCNAGVLEYYLANLREDLGKMTGHVLWTGKHDTFVNCPLGKNMVSKVSHEMAKYLGKVEPASFTFHSFRRSSATNAADEGASVQLLHDFFG